MMRFGTETRPIQMKTPFYTKLPTNDLASRYIKCVRKTDALGAPSVWPRPFAGWRLRRLNLRRPALLAELLKRYEGVIHEIYTHGGVLAADKREQAVRSMLREVQNALWTDKSLVCFSEVLWLAITPTLTAGLVLPDRLRRKLHLRAILDELPNSDERGVLRSWVFAKDSPPPEMLTEETLDLIESGFEILADYLLELGSGLDALTQNVIRKAELSNRTHAVAQIRIWLVGG